MPGRGQGDDAGGLGPLHGRRERQAHRHVAKMVDAELAFPAGADAPFRAGHDAGIIDENVETAFGVVIVARELLDRFQVRQVHRGNFDFAGHVSQGIFRHFDAAGRNGHPRPGAGKGADGLEADAGIPACDDGILAGEVYAFKHLAGGRFAVEA